VCVCVCIHKMSPLLNHTHACRMGYISPTTLTARCINFSNHTNKTALLLMNKEPAKHALLLKTVRSQFPVKRMQCLPDECGVVLFDST